MKYESEMPDSVFVKNNYYPGKLLHAADFIREQKYGDKKLEFINRTFHGCGIIEGLDVRMEEDGTLRVSEGSAIDPRGKILIVPAETTVHLSRLEGLQEIPGQDFILGIRYAERTVGEERNDLKSEQPSHGARIMESFALRAYAREEWKNLKDSEAGKTNALTQKMVLFQDDDARIVVTTPKAVPSDSIFRCCIQVLHLHGDSGISWQCTAKLQGAFFAESGQDVRLLQGDDTIFSGSAMCEWEICTEENRKNPITLELANLEISSGNSDRRELGTCRLLIGTEPSYEDIVRKYLWQEAGASKKEADWLPLAYIKESVTGKETRTAFEVSKEQNVRLKAFCPAWEQTYRQEAERSGLIDIKWRGLLKLLRQNAMPQPRPFEPLPPQPSPQQPGPSREQIQEMIREQAEEEREKCIRRGIAVIPIPRHYRKGRILVSEEIAHGFPGEEVFLWCGRVFEEKNYAYWTRDKMRYFVLSGDEGLFSDPRDSGWKIEKQAVRQNVEAGTFQVALTLSKGRRRNRSREVAISWIAVKTI